MSRGDRLKVFVRHEMRTPSVIVLDPACMAAFVTTLWSSAPVYELAITPTEIRVVLYAHQAGVPDGELAAWGEHVLARAIDAGRSALTKEPT